MQKKLKSVFLTGLAVVMPVGLTIYIFFFLIEIMDSLLLVVPDRYQPDAFLNFHLPGLGAIVTLGLIYFCGLITQSYFGNKLVNIGEALLDKIPIVRSIYQAMKQIANTIFMDHSAGFKKVVLFQFPSKTIYSVGFVTGVPDRELNAKICNNANNVNYVSVFMPTAPNPTTGLYMLIPECELIYLDISVEEAFTLIISAGIVMPSVRVVKTPKVIK